MSEPNYKIRVLSMLTGLTICFGFLTINQPKASIRDQVATPNVLPQMHPEVNKPLLPYTKQDMIEQCRTNSECYILAEAIVYEARSEPLIGQYAVASVILNRVDSRRFPNTVRGVVYQKSQFEYVPNKHLQKPQRPAWEKAHVIAFELLNNLHERVTNSDHYLNPTVVKKMPRWTRVYPYQMTIGRHDFYVSSRG